MNFDQTARARDLHARVTAFMDAHVYPNEQRFRDEIAAGIAEYDAGGVLQDATDITHGSSTANPSTIDATKNAMAKGQPNTPAL